MRVKYIIMTLKYSSIYSFTLKLFWLNTTV